MVDFGFETAKGAHAVVLTAIEEDRASCDKVLVSNTLHSDNNICYSRVFHSSTDSKKKVHQLTVIINMITHHWWSSL